MDYKDYVKMVAEKIDKIDSLDDMLSGQKVKLLLLGSHAKEAISDKYCGKRVEIGRKTDDIDLYCVDAPILCGGEFVIPHNSCVTAELTPEKKVEIFSYISGFDQHDNYFRTYVDEALANGNFEKLYESERSIIYCPTPDIWVVNKLFAYDAVGGIDRKKDLKDITEIVRALAVNPEELKKVEQFVELMGRNELYKRTVETKKLTDFE